MNKGDCILFEADEVKYLLILHHINDENDIIKYGFIISGESFRNIPTKTEIELCGILGYKYQNDTSDLLNSSKRNQQKYDSSTFYTGVKYDVISLPHTLFSENDTKIKTIANIEFNPKFYPMPNSYSRLNTIEEVCQTIKDKISKRDPNTISWSTIYDSYPLKEILITNEANS